MFRPELVNVGQLLVEQWPRFGRIGPISVERCRILVGLVKFGKMFDQTRPIWVEHCKSWSNLVNFDANIDQVWPKHAQLWPYLPDLGRISARIDQIQSKWGRCLAPAATFRAPLGNSSAIVGQLRRSPGSVGVTLGAHGEQLFRHLW